MSFHFKIKWNTWIEVDAYIKRKFNKMENIQESYKYSKWLSNKHLLFKKQNVLKSCPKNVVNFII